MPCRTFSQSNVSGKPSEANVAPVFVSVLVPRQQYQMQVYEPAIWVLIQFGPVSEVQDRGVPHTLWLKFVLRAGHAGVPPFFMINKAATPALLLIGAPPEAAAASMLWRVMRQFVVFISHLEWL